MSPDRWMDYKEAIVHIYGGIILSHKKECILVSSRASYIEWSKSEREILTSYTDTYIWNLEGWCWLIYFQGSNGDIENRLMDLGWGEEGEGKMFGDSNIEIYHSTCKINSRWEFSVWLRELKQGLWDRLKSGMEREMGGRSGKEGTWVCLWPILVDVWQKSQNSVKQLYFNLKIHLKVTLTKYFNNKKFLKIGFSLIWKKRLFST